MVRSRGRGFVTFCTGLGGVGYRFVQAGVRWGLWGVDGEGVVRCMDMHARRLLAPHSITKSRPTYPISMLSDTAGHRRVKPSD